MTDFIVTPTYNERGSIRPLIEHIARICPDARLLVVDDNSPDGTAEVVRELMRAHPNLMLKERPGKLGLASAYLGAFKDILAHYPDARAIVTIDADLQHDPAVIMRMLKEIESSDAVFGSRYVKGGGVRGWELWRYLLSWGGNRYARLVAWSRFHDLTGGYNCFSAALLRRYNLDAIRAEGYGYQMEMKIIAERLGARTLEVPIIFSNRTHGHSKISSNIVYEGLVLPWRFSPLWSFFTKRKPAQ